MFNAHWIHLDPRYCREVEGYRNTLVHGPLTLVLILSALRAKLHKGEMVLKLDYRNLAPLYVEEEMRVCVKRDPEKTEKFDVWIEGKEGGYAFKGSAIVGKMDMGPKSNVYRGSYND
jgi:hydroxyacyl-ACP dehydratase HTD2-like protein with hotdog domain